MLMSLLLPVWQELHHKHALDQTKGTCCDGVIMLHNSARQKERKLLLSVSAYFCPILKFVPTEKEGMKRRTDIFKLFSSTSLFQKSQTTRCITVSGCSELLRLLNGSSLPSPQNCFIVVLKVYPSHLVGYWVMCLYLPHYFVLKL